MSELFIENSQSRIFVDTCSSLEYKFRDVSKCTMEQLSKYIDSGTLICATAKYVDESGNLHFTFADCTGIIAYDNVDVSIRDMNANGLIIAKKCVGHNVCFKVERCSDSVFILNRAAVQTDYMNNYLSEKYPGDIIPCKVTAFSSFGAFCDVGCGVSALLPNASISVSRIHDPEDRLCIGQHIHAVIKSVDEYGRFTLTLKELLGTWEENMRMFAKGQTVIGIVRGTMEYGVFIEIAPNISGLAEIGGNQSLEYGDIVVVKIKEVSPEKMKIRVEIIKLLAKNEPGLRINMLMPRFHPEKTYINKWVYSPENCEKVVMTEFSLSDDACTSE